MKPNKLALLALLGIVLLSLTYTFTSPASAGTAVGADTGKKKHPFGATAASFSLRFAEANAKPTKQSRTLVVITTAVSLWHITETSLVTLARVKDDFDLILIDDKVTPSKTIACSYGGVASMYAGHELAKLAPPLTKFPYLQVG